MGQTITEKILAAHCGKGEVRPGELINARVDLVLANDITAPLAIKEFKKMGVEEVFDRDKVVLVPDHFAPNKDIASAEQCKMVREFARDKEITNFFEVGRMGIEHALLPEQGLVVPGDVVVGADSHTCTYGALGAFSTGVGSTDVAAAIATGELWLKVPQSMKFVMEGSPKEWVTGKDFILHIIGMIGVDGALYRAMEFTGSTIAELSMDSRFAMANMAIEAGGKSGIFPVDEKTVAYVNERKRREPTLYASDDDAEYASVIEINADDVDLTVAFPHLPSNTRRIGEVGRVEIDQVVIGSCTNGRLEDLRIAARILEGRKVAENIRTIVIPATQAIYKQAIAEGLVDIFVDANAAVSTPTCGPCLGGHMGILAKGERALATTNRNFVGRMGHPESEVYLSGPAVAAASAVAGRIIGPDEF
ncbi:MAG: 3-isopropylmalate dehydratase large subunit [Candidatus Aquicultorales bacterium]